QCLLGAGFSKVPKEELQKLITQRSLLFLCKYHTNLISDRVQCNIELASVQHCSSSAVFTQAKLPLKSVGALHEERQQEKAHSVYFPPSPVYTGIIGVVLKKNSLPVDDITLHGVTAHPNLSISGDKKSFTHEAQPQKVPSNPERFDSTVCVLGSDGFSSGKHYWEVDVVSSTDWDLGVARKSIQRKGKLSLSPKEGFWALGLSGRDYWAKTDPWTLVYLSYQEGQVIFFNVTDMSVLFTFNDCSFSGEVYPFFKNSHKETTMRICSIKEEYI
uniref:B30.2/SPRY domain-containing protein n=1 Tax=Chrysemys picta bellii TaxID=8478 RepID=A0A8C3F2A8_CHRPI